MSKTKHTHAIIGTITVAVPFDPGNLTSAVKAEAEIRAAAAGLQNVRLVDVTTRMGKLPLLPTAPAPAATIAAQHQKQAEMQKQPDMPDIPAALKR